MSESEASRTILSVPPNARTLGYSRLIEGAELRVVPPRSLSYVGTQGGRREYEVDGCRSTVLPPAYDPGPDLFAHLEFALKHEEVNLEVLAAYFAQVEAANLAAHVRATPKGRYARKAWFLYEWLTGDVLDLPDLKAVGYVPLVDPSRFHTARPNRSRRHAIDENLLGTREFCPMVERTPALEALAAQHVEQDARELLARYDEDTLKRAVSYLYMKETRSTWAIEREKPNPQRTERFVQVLRDAAKTERLSESEWVRLQNVVVGPTYSDARYRTDQNYVGSGYVGRGVVEYVCPKPEDVRSMMDGLHACAERMFASRVDPVVAASVLGFGFVFVHPFRDGNGRLHRWLIHHVLSRSGFTPPGVIFPVSAVMLKRRAEYAAALELLSRPLNALVDYDVEEDGSLSVRGETALHYRYFDCTLHAEALHRWTAETVRTELEEELDFLVRYRATRARMDEVVDMPEKDASLFIKLVSENGGRLSKTKRPHFPELGDEVVARLEAVVQTQMLGT